MARTLFATAPAGALFQPLGSAENSSSLDAACSSANGADAPQFEMVALRAARAPTPFASLSSSALAQQQRQQAEAAAAAAGRPLFSQVPLFELARAASGPAIETGLRVIKVAGDGRCMFRALAQGLARNQGRFLGKAAEEQEADQLRLAVAEALCRTAKRRNEFASAVYAVEAEDKLQNYCRRILSPAFWGGEPELLVLAQMLRTPILVYIPAGEAGRGGARGGFVQIQAYGQAYAKTKSGKARRPVRLVYSGANHYDLAVSR